MCKGEKYPTFSGQEKQSVVVKQVEYKYSVASGQEK